MLKTDDKVKIVNTGSNMDGQLGTILGISVDYVVKLWIVGLDTPYMVDSLTWKAVVIPDACLERV